MLTLGVLLIMWQKDLKGVNATMIYLRTHKISARVKDTQVTTQSGCLGGDTRSNQPV
jgi:hypothetical protein